jgi:hypothetical protein
MSKAASTNKDVSDKGKRFRVSELGRSVDGQEDRANHTIMSGRLFGSLPVTSASFSPTSGLSDASGRNVEQEDLLTINFYHRDRRILCPLEVAASEYMDNVKFRLLQRYYKDILPEEAKSKTVKPSHLKFYTSESKALSDSLPVRASALCNNDVVEVVVRGAMASSNGRDLQKPYETNAFHPGVSKILDFSPKDAGEERTNKWLLKAALDGNESEVVKLVHCDSCDFEKLDSDELGRTCLHHCVLHGLTTAVYHLVTKFPQYLSTVDKHGNTSLHLACSHVDPVKSAMYVRYFLETLGSQDESSASTQTVKLLTSKTKNGQTPLMICLASSNVASAGILIGLKRDHSGKWAGYSCVRNELFKNDTLLRHVAANSPFILHSLVESCREETGIFKHGHRLVVYRLRHLFGNSETRVRDTPISIFLSSRTPQCQSLWRLKALQMVVETKWQMFGHKSFYKDIFRHSMLLLTTVAGYASRESGSESSYIALCRGVSAVLSVYILVTIESKEFREAGWGLTGLPWPSISRGKLAVIPSRTLKVPGTGPEEKNTSQSILRESHGSSADQGNAHTLKLTSFPQLSESTMRPRNSSWCAYFPRYFLSYANVIDFCGLSCVLAAGILSLFGSAWSEPRQMVSSAGSLLLWVASLQLLSVTRAMGVQSAMVERMVVDVFRMAGIYFVFLMAFNCAFYGVLNDSNPMFDGFFRGLFSLFLGILGDYSFLYGLYTPADSFYFNTTVLNTSRLVRIYGEDSAVSQNVRVLSEIIFIGFGIIMNLVLVNMLIAFMTNSYEETKRHSECEFFRKRAQRLLVLESTLGHHVRRSLFTDVLDETRVWENCDGENPFGEIPHISQDMSVNDLFSVHHSPTMLRFTDPPSHTSTPSGGFGSRANKQFRYFS